MDNLSVWHDGEDWVIASSANEATAICEGMFGSYEGDYPTWRKLPDDKLLRLVGDESTFELTCAEWIKRNGRGHLCSTDY